VIVTVIDVQTTIMQMSMYDATTMSTIDAVYAVPTILTILTITPHHSTKAGKVAIRSRNA